MTVDRALIEAVLTAREEAEAASVKVRTAREVFSVENASLLQDETDAKEQMLRVEETLREAALVEYALTKNKQPGPGLGIRVISTPIYDPEKALAWAKERHMALALDVKAFKKLVEAEAEGINEFVTIAEEPQATIASDLAAALDKAEVEA